VSALIATMMVEREIKTASSKKSLAKRSAHRMVGQRVKDPTSFSLFFGQLLSEELRQAV